VSVRQKDSEIVVERISDAPDHKAMHGLTRSLIQNAVTGVTEGFAKTLLIQGVGYRGALQGQDINLQVGYSHPVMVSPREGIELEMPNATTIVVRGIDKQRVGQMAAEIRKIRPPEPYKGKGIRYSDEQIRRKVGKTG
jgi:large subunit ribosomal protein L6